MKRSLFLAVAAVLVLTGSLSGGVDSAAPTPVGGRRHCVAETIPIGSSERTAPMRCFATLPAAHSAIALNSIKLGTLYDYTSAGGRSVTLSGSSCNSSSVPDLRTYNFNDLTTSLDNYCNGVTLYAALNYTGTAQTYARGRTNYVGDAINNQTTSLVFKP